MARCQRAVHVVIGPVFSTVAGHIATQSPSRQPIQEDVPGVVLAQAFPTTHSLTMALLIKGSDGTALAFFRCFVARMTGYGLHAQRAPGLQTTLGYLDLAV